MSFQLRVTKSLNALLQKNCAELKSALAKHMIDDLPPLRTLQTYETTTKEEKSVSKLIKCSDDLLKVKSTRNRTPDSVLAG